MQTENILACVRIKPASLKDEELCCAKYDQKSVIMVKTNERYDFEFVFDEQNETNDIFTKIGVPNIEVCFQGVNVCIFAYGQTSSGKTFTMRGTNDKPGLIPLTLKYIFDKIKENGEFEAEIKLSYIEIYNESVNDLLNEKNANLDIRENITKGIHIPGITEQPLKNEIDAMEYFHIGESSRKLGETCLNDESSRSHTIFRLNFEIRYRKRPDKIIYSVLNLVDLAGSEGVSKAKTEGVRKREGANINKSLLALSNVISRLSKGDGNFINFRDSKLTRLLQPCLGGNSKTIVICTINPSSCNHQESVNTLKFGISAGVIKNQIKVNEKDKWEKMSTDKTVLNQTIKENEDLKNDLKLAEENIINLNIKIEDMEKFTGELSEEIKELQGDYELLKRERDDLIKTIDQNVREKKILEDHNKELIELLREFEDHKQEDSDSKKLDVTNLCAAIKEIDERFTEEQAKHNELKNEYIWKAEKVIKLQSDISLLENKFKEELSKRDAEMVKKEVALNEHQKMIFSLREEIKYKEELLRQQQQYASRFSTVKNAHSPHSNEILLKENKNMGNGAEPLSIKVPALSRGAENCVSPIHQNSNSCGPFDLLKKKVGSLEVDDLETLEFATSVSSKLYQKNKIIENLSLKVNKLLDEIRKKEDAILELENELAFNKVHNETKKKISLSSEGIDDISGSVTKKRKADDYTYVQKKIKNSPEKDEYKKHVKVLESKLKNFEKAFSRKKAHEEETSRRIQHLTSLNIMYENKLNENMLFF